MASLHIICINEKGACSVITGSCSLYLFRVSVIHHFLKEKLILLKFSVIILVCTVQFMNGGVGFLVLKYINNSYMSIHGPETYK